MTVNKKSIANLKKGGVVARDVIYKKISRLAPKAIDRLDILLDSQNPSVQLGAINKVIDKTIPNAENPKDNTSLQINVFIPILKENKLAL